jgi:hypothetical protein
MLDSLWSVPIQGQVAERLARPDFGRWLAQVQQVRRCSHPVRLAGTSPEDLLASLEERVLLLTT